MRYCIVLDSNISHLVFDMLHTYDYRTHAHVTTSVRARTRHLRSATTAARCSTAFYTKASSVKVHAGERDGHTFVLSSFTALNNASLYRFFSCCASFFRFLD